MRKQNNYREVRMCKGASQPVKRISVSVHSSFKSDVNMHLAKQNVNIRLTITIWTLKNIMLT